MKELKLSVTHIKILYTISLLNKKRFYPLPEGVFKIVHGDLDDETAKFVSLQTFSTLISYNSKKVNNLIISLVRYGLLERIYDKEHDQLLLIVTEKGEIQLGAYFTKHKKVFKKKEKTFKPTIFKI